MPLASGLAFTFYPHRATARFAALMRHTRYTCMTYVLHATPIPNQVRILSSSWSPDEALLREADLRFDSRRLTQADSKKRPMVRMFTMVIDCCHKRAFSPALDGVEITFRPPTNSSQRPLETTGADT